MKTKKKHTTIKDIKKGKENKHKNNWNTNECIRGEHISKICTFFSVSLCGRIAAFSIFCIFCSFSCVYVFDFIYMTFVLLILFHFFFADCCYYLKTVQLNVYIKPHKWVARIAYKCILSSLNLSKSNIFSLSLYLCIWNRLDTKITST